MRRFCSICLSPACTGRTGLVWSHGAPIQLQWIAAQVYLSRYAAAQGNCRLSDFNKAAKPRLYWYAEDVSLQTWNFRVEWHLAIKTKHCVIRQSWKAPGKSRPGCDQNERVYKSATMPLSTVMHTVTSGASPADAVKLEDERLQRLSENP